MKRIIYKIINIFVLMQTMFIFSTRSQIVTKELEAELLVNPNYPTIFEGMSSNVIIDDNCSLDAFYEKLYQSKFRGSQDPISVVHIGDSHVAGRFFPKQVGDNLEKNFPSVKFSDFGKNGATFTSFMNSGLLPKVYQQNPDLVILSFGTNEGYSSTYTGERHYGQIAQLISTIKEQLPNVLFLLTTPTGCYLKNGKINPKNGEVARTIVKYANENNMAAYDLYDVLGGEDYACQNLKAAKYFRVDGVHFTWDAYKMQGIMLYNAIINGFLDYIENTKQ